MHIKIIVVSLMYQKQINNLNIKIMKNLNKTNANEIISIVFLYVIIIAFITTFIIGNLS